MKIKLNNVLMGILIGTPSLSLGAPPGADLLTETDYYAEQPVVLSVSKLAQSQAWAPAAVTVIDRSMIEASGFRTLPDLLRLVPGFQVAWARGGFPAVSYQGLTSVYARRMQVLIDGRSVYNVGYGHIQWQLLPVALQDIDRIEVVRGPNAANDGVNAVQATIHIFTRHTASEQGANVHLAAGENGIRDAVLRYTGGSGDTRWRMTYLDRQDDWLDTRYFKPADATHDRFLNFRLDSRINTRDEATLEMGYNQGNWENSAVGFSFSPTQTSDLDSWYVQSRWRRVFDADNEWSMQFHHMQYQDVEEFTITSPLTSPTNLNNRFQRDSLEWNASHRIGPGARMNLGAEVRHETTTSQIFLNTDEALSGWIYRISAAGEWAFAPDWLLHGAAMLEDHYYGGTRLSPRLALNWQVAPEHTLRIGVARAWRTPTFLEQNADFKLKIGSSIFDQILLSPFKLQPERMTTHELGYIWQAPGKGIALDVRVFRNRLDNIIDAATPYPVPGEIIANGAGLTYANLFHATQRGGEYQLRWKYGEDGWISLWQSWVSTRSDSSAFAASTPHLNSGLLTQRTLGNGVSASLGYYRIGTLQWVRAAEATPAHDRLDLRVAKRWKSDHTHYELALVMQSVLGKFSEYNTTRYFDQRAFLSLDLRF